MCKKVVFFRNTHEPIKDRPGEQRTREKFSPFKIDGTINPEYNKYEELMMSPMWAGGAGSVCHSLYHKHYKETGMTLDDILCEIETYHAEWGQSGKPSIEDVLRGLLWLFEHDMAYYETYY